MYSQWLPLKKHLTCLQPVATRIDHSPNPNQGISANGDKLRKHKPELSDGNRLVGT
jgi:hypothetical protein